MRSISCTCIIAVRPSVCHQCSYLHVKGKKGMLLKLQEWLKTMCSYREDTLKKTFELDNTIYVTFLQPDCKYDHLIDDQKQLGKFSCTHFTTSAAQKNAGK